MAEEISIEWCKKKKKGGKEAAISKKIEAAAKKLGYTLYRNQNGAYQVGGRWMRSGLCVGASDFIGYSPKGVFTAIEVKQPGKKPDAAQQKFIDKVTYAGGIAGVVTSIDDLIRLLK